MSHVSQITESCLTDRRVMSRSPSHVTQETRHTVAEGGVKSYIVEPEMLSTHTHTFTRETALNPSWNPAGVEPGNQEGPGC